jgi:hypothetical protein
MSLFRRRPESGEGKEVSTPSRPEPTISQPPLRPPPPPSPATPRVAPHIERALITLTGKMQQVVEQLDTLDRRIDELAEAVLNAPSHSDVLEVRMHSAKLAAELARATVELRGEIGMASDEVRRAARAATATQEAREVPIIMPVDVEIEQAIKVNFQRRDGKNGTGGSWSETA